MHLRVDVIRNMMVKSGIRVVNHTNQWASVIFSAQEASVIIFMLNMNSLCHQSHWRTNLNICHICPVDEQTLDYTDCQHFLAWSRCVCVFMCVRLSACVYTAITFICLHSCAHKGRMSVCICSCMCWSEGERWLFIWAESLSESLVCDGCSSPRCRSLIHSDLMDRVWRRRRRIIQLSKQTRI